MRYFCHLDSAGNIEDTNLQLFSLIKAAEEWNEIISIMQKDEITGINNLIERLSFIVTCFGLSLSQLMGQNCSSPNDQELNQPDILLSNLLNSATTDRIKKNRLKSMFRDFLVYYGAIRHFGKTKDNNKYLTLEKLTLSEVNRFKKMTIEIWDLIIDMHRKDKEHDLEEIPSIGEIVHFKEL
jgi:hypothetical protein